MKETNGDDGMASAAAKRSVYEPDQADLCFPRRPVFPTLAEERLYREKHLEATCRAFSRFGYEYGFAGHVTVRDPEDANLFWTNPFAIISAGSGGRISCLSIATARSLKGGGP
ncbi:MAG: hypothetical protein ACRD4E_02090 [Bryobacteraceae bacterium]